MLKVILLFSDSEELGDQLRRLKIPDHAKNTFDELLKIFQAALGTCYNSQYST